MKLYTRRGDDGRTELFGGQRVEKDSGRIEACGTVDELNSVVGWALCACADETLRTMLVSTQSRLFELGADLATPRPGEGRADPATIARISAEHAHELEQWIDRICEPLEPMRHFVLPGGCELAARLHVARTVCRRAERACVALARSQPIGSPIVVYLNRLSDLLFAMGRRANQLQNVADVPWLPR
jgi:cob(I)alamin adenosyltransferase